jgi:hypothetical protein
LRHDDCPLHRRIEESIGLFLERASNPMGCILAKRREMALPGNRAAGRIPGKRECTMSAIPGAKFKFTVDNNECRGRESSGAAATRQHPRSAKPSLARGLTLASCDIYF